MRIICDTLSSQYSLPQVESFDAKYWTLHKTLALLTQRFLDVGVAGHLIMAEKLMQSYDEAS